MIYTQQNTKLITKKHFKENFDVGKENNQVINELINLSLLF